MLPRPKRKSIPLKVKLEAAILALGMRMDEVQWDHDPALGLRPVNADGTDYEPPQLDPRHITPRLSDDHKRKTFGDPTIPLSGDASRIAKASRLENAPLLRAAKKLGKEARIVGLSLASNPYPQRTPEHKAWVNGWFTASRKR